MQECRETNCKRQVNVIEFDPLVALICGIINARTSCFNSYH